MFLRRKTETFEMKADGLDSPVVVRRSPRARRISLTVNEARRGAVLTVPEHATLEEAGRFLAKHFEWLQDRLDAIPEAIPFRDGAEIPLRGETHRLVFAAEGPRRRGVVWREETNGHNAAEPPVLYVSGSCDHAPRRLRDWLRKQARDDLSDRCTIHAEALSVTPKRITVRDQSSRWGSCSAAGVLSFSWRLVLAPHHVLDYLAAHEVAHLREMNHGPKFWAHVRATCPDMETAKKWLRKNGAQLHRYGVEDETFEDATAA